MIRGSTITPLAHSMPGTGVVHHINRTILSNKIAVWFGLISFPLYLWHWPLLSFARIVESEVPSRNIRISAVVLSIVLAWLTFRLVEQLTMLAAMAKLRLLTDQSDLVS